MISLEIQNLNLNNISTIETDLMLLKLLTCMVRRVFVYVVSYLIILKTISN